MRLKTGVSGVKGKERELTSFLANGLPGRTPREESQGGFPRRTLRVGSQGGLPGRVPREDSQGGVPGRRTPGGTPYKKDRATHRKFWKKIPIKVVKRCRFVGVS